MAVTHHVAFNAVAAEINTLYGKLRHDGVVVVYDSPSSSSVTPTEPPSYSQPPPAALPPSSSSPPSGFIARNSVPEVYPQVLALPIARRPLFSGFYKAVVVCNPAVIVAIKEMMKRGQPYLGAFLLKDENTDVDVITDINQVHQFAQSTSVFTAPSPRDPNGAPGEKQEEGVTTVLSPTEGSGLRTSCSQVDRRMENPSCQHHPPHFPRKVKSWKSSPGPVQTSFLYNHTISIVSVKNLVTQPYNKDDQYIRAFMSEIVSVFKVASNVFDEPDKQADFVAAVSTGEVQELQDVLESLIVEDRLRKALLVLKKEVINAQQGY
ncbi:ATP-dependent protease La domain-containing protein [Amanita rubescens]|nr:ATP-dependent protease La domain-containing protein [Amanita rubescens]